MRLNEREEMKERLPTAAARKVDQLADRSSTLIAQLRALGDQTREVANARQRYQSRLHQAKQRVVSNPDQQQSRLMEITRKLENLDCEQQRLESIYQRISAKSTAVGGVLRRITEFISNCPQNRPIVAWSGSIADRAPGEDYPAAIERCRQEATLLHTEIYQQLHARVALQDVTMRIDAWVDRMARAGAPDIDKLYAPRPPDAYGRLGTKLHKPYPAATMGDLIAWPTYRETFRVNAMGQNGPVAGAGSVEHPDIMGVLAWLFPDQMKQRLRAEAEANADDDGLPIAGRAEKIAQLRTKLLAIEREEESLICQAASNGIEVDRRPDADVCAILEIAPEIPVGEATSPEKEEGSLL